MKFSEILLTAGIASVVTLGTLYVAGRFFNARREDIPEEAETTAEVEEFEEVPMEGGYILREPGMCTTAVNIDESSLHPSMHPADMPLKSDNIRKKQLKKHVNYYYDKLGRRSFKDRVKDWAAEKLVDEIEKRDISITIHLKKV